MTLTPTPQAATVEVPTAEGASLVWWRLGRGLFALLLAALGVLLLLPPLLGYPRYEVSAGTLVARSVTSQRVASASTPVRRVTLGPLRKRLGTRAVRNCTGAFRDRQGRLLDLYTDCSPQVLLFSPPGQRPFAITPDDPQALLAALRSGASLTSQPATHRSSSVLNLLLSLPLFALAGLALLPTPRLRYLLTGDALLIRRRLGVDRLPYSGLAVRPARSRLGVRLLGTGLPGYLTGTFWTAQGQVQAAATSSTAPALLLSSNGQTYYLTPADPAALQAELLRRGASLMTL